MRVSESAAPFPPEGVHGVLDPKILAPSKICQVPEFQGPKFLALELLRLFLA